MPAKDESGASDWDWCQDAVAGRGPSKLRINKPGPYKRDREKSERMANHFESQE